MERDLLLFTLSAMIVGGAVGWLLGRRTGGDARRSRALEAELAASREEIESYRERVAEHFTRTSDLLRELTIRYRGVYDHLAEGARSLCPDRPSMLGEGIESALLEGGDRAERPETDETLETEETANEEPGRPPSA